MNWIIEFHNGKILKEGINHFDTCNKSLMNKIYFTDDENQYGFYLQNGNFFINNKIFDFKIDITNSFMEPFQSKTVKSILLPNDINESIHSWNIGYRLNLNNSLYEYKMSIYYNGNIYFFAKNYASDRTISKFKELKLR